MYKPITLSSGREIDIRPLSWETYWNIARQRMANETATINADNLDTIRREREVTLVECVRDFASLGDLTVPEVKEMEHHINRLSEPVIAEGNS